MTTFKTGCALIIGGAVIFGCASSPPPTDRMASAVAATRGASELGAASVPQAELHVKLAQEQTARARALIEQGDNAHADLALRRAQADAELAIAIAKEDATRRQAEQAMAEVRALSSRTQ
jgi:hypothetical protein